MKSRKYLTIKEACALLKISRPTFDKIRKTLKLREFSFGARPRFLHEDIQSILDAGTGKPICAAKIESAAKVDLTVFSPSIAADVLSDGTTFDLRKIRRFDPHGVLGLFCSIVGKVNAGNVVNMIVEDGFICNHLRGLGFFAELEKKCGDKIAWDKTALRTDYTDIQYPIPLTNVRFQKDEAPVVAGLVQMLRGQGFSETIGGYIGWIYGELADNATTHLTRSDDAADSYLLAQRYRFIQSKQDCIIISIADAGPGIHATLKKNPKHSALSDREAFLIAFKPGISSWGDEYNRGRGLTDVLTIAMGNESIIRAESGGNVWHGDFKKNDHRISFNERLPKGTRVSLVLIDHAFDAKTRDDAAAFIDGLARGQ
ncbi:MAG: helix-turn-helix domain-containing protein [Elusimicrobia bacterium]|nr:helix-turn-helix domain-containing protein [Elusimicrobiota bacterium]